MKRRTKEPTPPVPNFADGTQPGTEHHSPVVARAFHKQTVAKLEHEVYEQKQLAKQAAMETAEAQQRIADLKLVCSALIDIIGGHGFLQPDQQATLRYARTLLGKTGKPLQEWVDRVPKT